MAGQGLPHHQLRVAPVVAPGGVEVVDAAFKGLVNHGEGGRLVDA